MHKLKTITALILIVTFGLTSCATIPGSGQSSWSSPEACITTYVITACALGGLGGLLIAKKKDKGKGAIAGCVGGALLAVAYAWGHCSTVKSQQVKDYNETLKEVGYSPQKGSIVKINEYSLDPSAVAPGGTLDFNANYYVMTPTEQKDISVTETRILKVYDEDTKQFVELKRFPETITIAPGLRRANGQIPIPSKALEAKYLIGFMITYEDKTDTVEMPLTITTDKQLLAKAEQESLSRKAKHQKEDTEKKETVTVASAKEVSSSAQGEKSVQSVKEKYLLIVAEKVNLREKPDTKAKIITTVSKDEKYPLIETKEIEGKKWYQIRLDDGKVAWLISTAARVLEDTVPKRRY